MAKAKRVRLIERTVQDLALQYMEQYYKIKHNQRNIFANIEERTKKKYGMKRADGLLAYKLTAQKAYVVSMEAKSHKTLPALKPYRVNKLWRNDAIWKGFLVSLGSGSLFVAWRWVGEGYIRMLIPFGVWALASLIHAFIFRNSYKYQEMEVVHQVFQYPGNEQWLSLSEDAFDMIDAKIRQNLFKICEARGIGVLMVDRNKNVNLISKPVFRRKWFGDFLSYYHNEEDIRKKLGLKFKPEPVKPKKRAYKKK